MENDDTMKWCRKNHEWDRDERSEEPMDKKSVRAVAVTIFSGVLFLESMFAGGVASEETGKVLDGMRGLRRVNNVHYLVTNSYSGSQDIVQQTQEIWADLLDETWAAEYKNTDADGAMTFLKEFCDGVTVNSYQAGVWSQWNGYSTRRTFQIIRHLRILATVRRTLFLRNV